MAKTLDIRKRILHKKNAKYFAKKFEVRDSREKEFFLVDNLLVDEYAKVLKAPATIVYVSLCRHVGKDQSCWPSIDLLCDELGIGPSTVIRALRTLEAHSLIAVRREPGEQNLYSLLNRRKWRKIAMITRTLKRRGPVDKGDLMMKSGMDMPIVNDGPVLIGG